MITCCSLVPITVSLFMQIIKMFFPWDQSWSRYSYNELYTYERHIFRRALKRSYKCEYITIGDCVGERDYIRTISMNTESTNTPIVLLHGVGGGIALWCQNLDELSLDRPVYAIDLLGFGRSSRPVFSKSPERVEQQFVTMLDFWRRKMKLEKFILLGHHFGGYLATRYALEHPKIIEHLILADPWGFTQLPLDLSEMALWVKVAGYVFYSSNLLSLVRMFGPLGLWTINFIRADLNEKFVKCVNTPMIMSRYIYHCNAQEPTGETAFNSLTEDMGWAKNPMVDRIVFVNKNIPITMIYGSRVNYSVSKEVQNRRPGTYVNVKIINAAGQHVYADKPKVFNKFVIEACKYKKPEAE